MKRLLLHAPGVHTGGGYVLLQAILDSPDLPPLIASLDSRALTRLRIPVNAEIHSIKPSAKSRLTAELHLQKMSLSSDFLLCFHGLPPLFRNSAYVSVFVQNRLNLGEDNGSNIFRKGGLKTFLKQRAFRSMSSNADEYIVQTPSMRDSLLNWLRSDKIPVRMLPFLDLTNFDATEVESKQIEYDFIYVADGISHKNHLNLIEAWVRLAKEGLRPSLLLTLSKRDNILLDKICTAKLNHNLNVSNEGDVSRERIFDLYQKSRALVFPSTCESFGIPLIEAAKFGLPIVASEMDYVRDVSTPCETFDPKSPVSIARAIKRFLGKSEIPLVPSSAQSFVEQLLGHSKIKL